MMKRYTVCALAFALILLCGAAAYPDASPMSNDGWEEADESPYVKHDVAVNDQMDVLPESALVEVNDSEIAYGSDSQYAKTKQTTNHTLLIP